MPFQMMKLMYIYLMLSVFWTVTAHLEPSCLQYSLSSTWKLQPELLFKLHLTKVKSPPEPRRRRRLTKFSTGVRFWTFSRPSRGMRLSETRWCGCTWQPRSSQKTKVTTTTEENKARRIQMKPLTTCQHAEWRRRRALRFFWFTFRPSNSPSAGSEPEAWGTKTVSPGSHHL